MKVLFSSTLILLFIMNHKSHRLSSYSDLLHCDWSHNMQKPMLSGINNLEAGLTFTKSLYFFRNHSTLYFNSKTSKASVKCVNDDRVFIFDAFSLALSFILMSFDHWFCFGGFLLYFMQVYSWSQTHSWSSSEDSKDLNSNGTVAPPPHTLSQSALWFIPHTRSSALWS